MKTTALSLLALCCVAGCSAGGVSDGGFDAGEQEPQERFFDVSATAAMVPESMGLLTDAGVSASVAGLTARVEEPFRVATGGALGVFSEKTLDATGAFAASQVSTLSVSLGVAGGLRDDTDAGVRRVVRSATVFWDVGLEGKKPDRNITQAKAWAMPQTFHQALTNAVGAAAISPLTEGVASTLEHAGFIFGRVVDASGQPVAGVTLKPSQASRQARFFYPTASYAGVGSSTSSNGTFVYVHNGKGVETFSFSVEGRPEYKSRTAGASADACLVLTVYPGDAAP